MKRNHIPALLLFLYLSMIFIVNAIAQPVPDTGQTKCYNDVGNIITCPSPNQRFYGQDANYTINSMSYTKLGYNGVELPDDALHFDNGGPWIMTIDNITGLIWEVKSNKDGVQNYDDPNDADNCYSSSGYSTAMKDFIDAINYSEFGGYTDWRLPNIKELTYIVDHSVLYPGPTINTLYFPNTNSSYFYTSSSNSSFLRIFFKSGYETHPPNGPLDDINFLRAVRKGFSQPQSLDHFTDNGDGTITDNLTGLMWQKTISSNKMTWEQALAHCANSTIGNYSDWRLPTIKELKSLVDYSHPFPTINTSYFPNTFSDYYWSSTTYVNDPKDSYGINFERGREDRKNKLNVSYLRAVRNKKDVSVGYLQVSIEPQGARDAGAKWRRIGTTIWRDSGYTENEIAVGNHTVEFNNIPGWIKPLRQIITVKEKQISTAKGTYLYNQDYIPPPMPDMQPVPDTGQTNCYDDAGNVITCPSPGQRFYGQDANYNINPMSYTKLDVNGNDLPDSANSWAMVRDNVTGLIWEAKRNQDTVKNYDDPHDGDNTYTWYDPNDPYYPGTPGEHTDTEDFLDVLNSSKFGGYSDWRLPTIKELAYLVKKSNNSDYRDLIDTQYFPNTGIMVWHLGYWSSTSSARGIDYAGCITYFNDFISPGGLIRLSRKDNKGFVRAVRGGQSQPFVNFTDNQDGTITDNLTGLMWQKTISSNKMTWEQALAHCANSTVGNYSDWRLPNLKELYSLVDYNRYNPAINTIYFPYIPLDSNVYWSSTTDAKDASVSIYVDFYEGTAHYLAKSNTCYVRAVRDAQVLYGNLKISIEPQMARDAGVQWRRKGTSIWHNSGYTETNVPVGNYTIEFKVVPGWRPEGTIDVQVQADTTTQATGYYFEQAVVLPGVLLLLDE